MSSWDESSKQPRGTNCKNDFCFRVPTLSGKGGKKGRTKNELHHVIQWLTGFNDKALLKQINDKVSFEEFFQRAKLNPNAHLITGMICGYRVEEI